MTNPVSATPRRGINKIDFAPSSARGTLMYFLNKSTIPPAKKPPTSAPRNPDDGRMKNEFDLIIENVTDVNVMTEQEATSCYQSILTKRGTYTYNAEIAGTILELFRKIDGSKLSK